MSNELMRSIEKEYSYNFEFSICTLVTNWTEYNEMVSSFYNAGFTPKDCEFIFADNTQSNSFDAYTGLNRFLQEANGKYIIVCHQDVLLNYDNRKKLEQCISDINKIDSKWAVLGNAGGNNLYKVSMIITEQDLTTYRNGILPSKVHSLDENFLLIKASANLAVSNDLGGYHFYGTDICIIAECLGYTSYAIDFHLLHKSSGKVDEAFFQLRSKFIKKYTSFFRGRYFRTTITNFYLSGNTSKNWFRNIAFVRNLYRAFYKYRYKYLKKL